MVSHRRRRGSRAFARILRVSVVLALIAVTATSADTSANADPLDFVRRSLDGRNNNLRNPTWGMAGTDYIRRGDTNYADGIGEPVGGPSPRYVSNRIFNDSHQNLFSENGVSQWGFAWGQFMDHTFGLRQITSGEFGPIPFDQADPIEEFLNEFGEIGFERSAASPGTGVPGVPRQHINTISSYIDGSNVYSNSADRLEWLREGPVDGTLSNNTAKLLVPDGLLPNRAARGNPDAAPPTEIDGRLRLNPDRATVAGDFRSNENMALQAQHNLFALEHNRIVDLLPTDIDGDGRHTGVDEQIRFEIARRVVGAEQQFITYTEFLPALGVQLSPYRGYRSGVISSLANEFAVVGYRGHSMIHGEFEPGGELANYTPEELEAIEAQGIEVEIEGDEIEFVVPLNVAFFNPDLLGQLHLDAVLKGLGGEPQYKNDEQLDNQIRSVLFQVPKPGIPNPEDCLDGPPLPECFDGVVDLGAIDIARGRDHGMPLYNDLREAYGLPRIASFTEITGEDTEEFPDGLGIDDPASLEFVELRDADGNLLEPGTPEADEEAVTGIRASTTAARLKAIYGDVDSIDAFVGMGSEAHIAGREFGPLQHAIWKDQFQRLRDGDRFFYARDVALPLIRSEFGIDYRRSLSQIIIDNTDLEAGDIEENVFLAPSE